MNTNKKQKLSREQLQCKIRDLESQLASSAHFLAAAMDKTSSESMMGSGVVIEIRYLGGKTLGVPCFIRDGLSKETVESIKRDLSRTYDLAVQFKP